MKSVEIDVYKRQRYNKNIEYSPLDNKLHGRNSENALSGTTIMPALYLTLTSGEQRITRLADRTFASTGGGTSKTSYITNKVVK